MNTNLSELLFTDSEPSFAGKPGKQAKPVMRVVNGALVDSWHMCVKNVSVSSRENQVMRLIDGNEGYWQSSGAQGKVRFLYLFFFFQF